MAAAFLFGSALGGVRPDSDIDLGVLLGPTVPGGMDAFRTAAALEERLGYVGRHPFDVRVLRLENALFSLPVVREGMMVYVCVTPYTLRFLELVALRYREDAPRYFKSLEEVLA